LTESQRAGSDRQIFDNDLLHQPFLVALAPSVVRRRQSDQMIGNNRSARNLYPRQAMDAGPEHREQGMNTNLLEYRFPTLTDSHIRKQQARLRQQDQPNLADPCRLQTRASHFIAGLKRSYGKNRKTAMATSTTAINPNPAYVSRERRSPSEAACAAGSCPATSVITPAGRMGLPNVEKLLDDPASRLTQ
jgi:hypothetical protein